MSSATIIMIVMICVGCALAMAGLAFLGYRAFGLMKAAKQAGVSSRTQVQEVMGRAQRLAPRLRELEAKQKAVAEKLASFSATTGKTDSPSAQATADTARARAPR